MAANRETPLNSLTGKRKKVGDYAGKKGRDVKISRAPRCLLVLYNLEDRARDRAESGECSFQRAPPVLITCVFRLA